MPLAVILASVVLAVASAAAWGAAEPQGYPAWLPTSAGVVWASISGLICATLAQSVLRKTREPVALAPGLLAIGVVAMLVIAGLEIALSVKVGDASLYEAWRDDKLGTGTIVFGAGVVVVLTSLVLFMGAVSYHTGVQSDKGTRFDSREGEPDALGALMAEENAERGERAER